MVLTLLIVLGLLNGLVLLPVLLSILGPPGEVIPLDPEEEDRIPLPTPDPSPRPERPVRTVSRGRVGGSHHHHHHPHHVSSGGGGGTGGGHHHHHHHQPYPRVPSDVSLSTITEEPSQYSSHEIIVQPELVVETTSAPGTSVVVGNSSSDSSSNVSVVCVARCVQAHACLCACWWGVRAWTDVCVHVGG